MTHLRKLRLEELQRRNHSQTTVTSYIRGRPARTAKQSCRRQSRSTLDRRHGDRVSSCGTARSLQSMSPVQLVETRKGAFAVLKQERQLFQGQLVRPRLAQGLRLLP